MSMLGPTEKALMKKDLIEIWSTKSVCALLIAVPFLLIVVAPVVYFILIYLAPVKDAAGVEQILALAEQSGMDFSERQGMYYVFTEGIAPLLFLMIPLSASSLAASCSFTGERERGTLQTLLLTPMPLKRMFRTKFLSCIFLSLLVSAISFGIFAVVTSVGNIMLKMPFFFDWNWLIVLFLAGLFCVLGTAVASLAFSGAKTMMESFLIIFYLLLPLVLLFLLQFTGVYLLDATVLLSVLLLVLVADGVLVFASRRSFCLKKLMR